MPAERNTPAPPPSPVLSPSQLARLAAVGEERLAAVGDVLYRVGDPTYPFIAIVEGEVATSGGTLVAKALATFGVRRG